MSTSVKVWVLLVTVFLASPLLGVWGLKFFAGGEDGVINLPCCATLCPTPKIAARGLRSTDNVACRAEYEVNSLEHGLTLELPAGMPNAVATFLYGGVNLPATAVSGNARISAGFLKALQQAAIDEFSVVLADGMQHLNVLVIFDGAGCRVFVQ